MSERKKFKFTNFSNLTKSVISVKEETALIYHTYQLITDGIYITQKDIAITHSGIYTILPEGVIKKVALYLGEIKTDRDPKYHAFLCDSLKNQLMVSSENALDNFKINRRRDQKFNVKIIERFKNTNYQDKELTLCMFCVRRLNSLIGGETELTAENFNLTDFLMNDAYLESSSVFNFDYDMIPGIYEKSWQSLADLAKYKNDFKCDKCLFSFHEKYFQKYLQVHYIGKQIGDKRVDIIKPLCIRCHAEEEGHGDIKKTPLYNEFITILESRGG